jgi:PAS domain-containing protein
VSQQEIETILCRHWASHLQTPVFLVDPEGNLLYYNEAAEAILGRRFAETGMMSAAVWSTAFKTTDENNVPIKPEELPLRIALSERRPANKRFWIVGFDNYRRYIETTALPLIGHADRFLGAVAFFWELNGK